MKKVSVITVNYNQPKVTEQLLRSIEQYNDYPEIEIIVVDNGSKANPVPTWKLQYPQYIFIRSEANLGFAGGNNLAVEEATGNYLFFVNNDTEFCPNLITRLIETMEQNPSVGMVSPKIRYYDRPEVLQYAGFTPMNFYTCRNLCIGQFETDMGQYDAAKGPTGYAHGAAMMVKREVIERAGLMAENFFLYYEEMDWCERIKRAGFDIWLNPEAMIYHKESVSVGKKSSLQEYFMNRNRILFIRRNAPFFARIVFCFHFIFLVTSRNLFNYLRDKKPELTLQLFKAIWWNISHSTSSTELGYPLK